MLVPPGIGVIPNVHVYVCLSVCTVQPHDLYIESPVSYWTANTNKVTGITQQTQATKSPFGKNTAFSTPIEHYLDQPKPHGIN